MGDEGREEGEPQGSAWADSFHEPLGELVHALTAVEGVVGSQSEGVRFVVERMEVGLPVELRERVDEQGRVTLRGAPPTQQIDTTVFPVLHQLRLGLTVEVERDDGDG